MKKVKIAAIAALSATLCFTGALVACGGGHEHTIELMKTAPTCEEVGYEEHYECTDCGKLFADAEGTTEITKADLTEIAALGHSGGYATCSSPAICVRCEKPYGDLGDHDYSLGYK